MISLAELEKLNNAELDDVYAQARSLVAPLGLFHGKHLGWLDTPFGRSPILRPVLHLAFRATPFGIDFDTRLWFFNSPSHRPISRSILKPAMRMGRFETVLAPSRWRETDTVGLHYEVSSLPRPIKSLLYDEVKPLSDDLCLCLGGINAAHGGGDCFWFALSRA